MMLPLVAIVGRPNVGKSTLFNRLIGKRQALVADQPGMTRDRHYGTVNYEDHEFHLVDTGGFDPDAEGSSIEALIREQTQIAIEESDLVIFLLDARDGLTNDDQAIIQMLRKVSRPVLYVANKVDGPKQEALVGDFYRSGAFEILCISAEHALGIDVLLEKIIGQFPSYKHIIPPSDTTAIRTALVGRPNAGKSALLNQLVGQYRSIVSDIPGTTRDPVDVEIQTTYGQFVLVDTAGIRRKQRSGPILEKLSVLRALRAINDADVICLVIDAQVGPSVQDAKIAALTLEAGRGLVLVFNKSDLTGTGSEARKKFTEQLKDFLHFVDFAPMLLMSSLTGKGTNRIFPTVNRIYQAYNKRIPTSELNRFLENIVNAHQPPAHHGREVRFYYISQPQVGPPTFVISTNAPSAVAPSYQRYLTNKLREQFQFEGSPIRIFLRGHNQQRE